MSASAFLLAAGYGTRLRPLTEHRPKPLVPVCGQALANYALALLQNHGIERAVVNAHHLPEKIQEWAERQEFELEVLVESPVILGTGGGLKNAARSLNERFVVVNGDILSDVDLSGLLSQVEKLGEGPAAAMALRPQRKEERYGIVASDVGGCVVDLVGLARAKAAGVVDRSTHFTGIHALNQAALERVPEGEACIVRSAYSEMVPMRRVAAIHHRGLWVDLGTPERYLAANLGVLSGHLQTAIDPLHDAGWALSGGLEGGCASNVSLRPSVRVMAPFWLGEGVVLEENVVIGPGTIVGEGSRIGKGASLRNTVVWDGCTVEAGASLQNCIVYDGGVLTIPNTFQ